MQPDLPNVVAPQNEADDRLQKKVESIYKEGSNVAEFFKKLQGTRDHSVLAEDSEPEMISAPHAFLRRK